MTREEELELVDYLIEDLRDVIESAATEEDVTYRKNILKLAIKKKFELTLVDSQHGG